MTPPLSFPTALLDFLNANAEAISSFRFKREGQIESQDIQRAAAVAEAWGELAVTSNTTWYLCKEGVVSGPMSWSQANTEAGANPGVFARPEWSVWLPSEAVKRAALPAGERTLAQQRSQRGNLDLYFTSHQEAIASFSFGEGTLAIARRTQRAVEVALAWGEAAADATNSWYYHQDGDTKGPLPWSEVLAAAGENPDVLVRLNWDIWLPLEAIRITELRARKEYKQAVPAATDNAAVLCDPECDRSLTPATDAPMPLAMPAPATGKVIVSLLLGVLAVPCLFVLGIGVLFGIAGLVLAIAEKKQMRRLYPGQPMPWALTTAFWLNLAALAMILFLLIGLLYLFAASSAGTHNQQNVIGREENMVPADRPSANVSAQPSALQKQLSPQEQARQAVERGNSAFSAHDTATAAAAYSEATTYDSQNQLAFFNLGGSYYALGRYSEAAEAYQSAVNLNPSDVDARLWLGIAYYQLGESPKAISEWQRVLQLDPNNQTAQNNLKGLGAF